MGAVIVREMRHPRGIKGVFYIAVDIKSARNDVVDDEVVIIINTVRRGWHFCGDWSIDVQITPSQPRPFAIEPERLINLQIATTKDRPNS